MRTHKQFLESAPKAALTAIHKRILQQQGLLSSSRILQDLLEHLHQADHLSAFDSKLQDWQRACLRWIYDSRIRGFSQSELMASVPKEFQSRLPSFLLEACEQLVIFRFATQGTFLYFGFLDYAHHFCKLPSAAPSANNMRWFGHGVQLYWHIVKMCKLILHGDIRITSSAELHRRSVNIIDESFTSTAMISDAAPADERVLILQYIAEHGWISQHDGSIQLTEAAKEALTQHPGRLRHHFFQWWLIRRFGLSAHDFRKWFQHWPEQLQLGELAQLLWPLTPNAKAPNPESATHAWTGLPRILREFWLIGILELNVEKGRHSQARISSDGIQWRTDGVWENELQNPQAPVGTPNFEFILPANSHTKNLFTAACISDTLSEDSFLRFQFSKEKMLLALRSGLSAEWLDEFLAWAKLPHGVASAMAEWRSIHCGARIRQQTTLRIMDPSKWDELSQFPQFLQHTEESIPNWGFVIKNGQEKAIRELLSHFGLEPPADQDFPQGSAIVHGTWAQDFGALPSVQGNPDYEWQPAEVRTAVANALAVQSKYNTDFQQFDPAQTLKVLRYAMVMEVPIEAVLVDPAFPKMVPPPQIYQILRINNRREPYRISATCTDGTPIDFTMDQIQKLRLTSV